MKHNKYFLLLLLSFPLVTNATLISDSVICDGSSLLRCALPSQNSTGNPYDATNTVGVDAEFDINNHQEVTLFSINIGDSEFTINNVGSTHDLSGFGFLTLTDLDWVGIPEAITGVSLSTSGVSTSMQGSSDGTSLDLSDVTFGADFVSWNMSSTHWDVDSFATFTLQTTHADVPEPSIFALMVLGLAVFGFSRKRKTA